MKDTKLAELLADIIEEFARRGDNEAMHRIIGIMEELKDEADSQQYTGVFYELERARDAKECNIGKAAELLGEIEGHDIPSARRFIEHLLRHHVKPSDLVEMVNSRN